MSDAVGLTNNLVEVFTGIQHNQMKGIPLLNSALKVECVDFQEWNGLVVGVLITPWFMNLMLLSCEQDEWSEVPVGTKQRHEFPSRSYEFTVNEFDGVGRCQNFPIHSPMNEFDNQEIAVITAEAFMERLMTESEQNDTALDEQRMEQFLQGRDMEQIHQEEAADEATGQCPAGKKMTERSLTRRELLRGTFTGDSE